MNVQEHVSYEVALRLVQLAPGICFVFGADGRIEYANSEVERVLWYASEDIPGVSIWSLIHPCDRENVELALRDISGDVEVEARVRKADGGYEGLRWKLVSSGDRIFCSAQDKPATWRELPVYTCEEHEAQMQERIGVLAGGIAHDFNNLLTGIIGSASLAAQDLPRDNPTRRLMEDVITAGQRAAVLTQQLLAYAGKGAFAISTLDLSAVAAEMVRVLRASIPDMVRLELDLPEHLPTIEADARQVQQIACNLLINALEAVGGHGVIRVSTGRVQLGSERSGAAGVSTLSPGEYVFFQVEDTGAGMDEDVKARIFDPFYSTKFVGRGLGLAAVSGFVRAHKGGIQLTTAPGKGSTFRVLLPMSHRAAQPQVAQHPRRDDMARFAVPAVWEKRA